MNLLELLLYMFVAQGQDALPLGYTVWNLVKVGKLRGTLSLLKAN